jgi:Protein of unknown function (DUF1493)
MDENLERDALEQRVLTLAAIRAGVSPRKVSPTTRLAQDLDIRGDDAAEFFDAYRKEFRVNLDELNMHWDQHFHPEAGLLLNTVFIVIGCVTLAGSLLVLFRFGGWLWSYNYFSPYRMYRTPTWIISGIVSLLCWTVAWHRGRSSSPITIADLIDAARAGRWVKSYGPGR